MVILSFIQKNYMDEMHYIKLVKPAGNDLLNIS